MVNRALHALAGLVSLIFGAAFLVITCFAVDIAIALGLLTALGTVSGSSRNAMAVAIVLAFVWGFRIRGFEP
jgi:hypothetical protein